MNHRLLNIIRTMLFRWWRRWWFSKTHWMWCWQISHRHCHWMPRWAVLTASPYHRGMASRRARRCSSTGHAYIACTKFKGGDRRSSWIWKKRTFLTLRWMRYRLKPCRSIARRAMYPTSITTWSGSPSIGPLLEPSPSNVFFLVIWPPSSTYSIIWRGWQSVKALEIFIECKLYEMALLLRRLSIPFGTLIICDGKISSLSWGWPNNNVKQHWERLLCHSVILEVLCALNTFQDVMRVRGDIFLGTHCLFADIPWGSIRHRLIMRPSSSTTKKEEIS